MIPHSAAAFLKTLCLARGKSSISRRGSHSRIFFVVVAFFFAFFFPTKTWEHPLKGILIRTLWDSSSSHIGFVPFNFLFEVSCV